MHPRKKLLYLGNKLAIHGRPPTSVDVLPSWLQQEGYEVISASSKKNKLLRLADMLLTLFRNKRKVDLVLIDTYSTQNFYYAVFSAALCRVYKLPYIPILRGGDLPKRLKGNKGQSKKLFGKAHLNVAPSLYMKQQFEEAGFQNIRYIPNTIAMVNYPFLRRKTISPKLLWVRSFAEIYNPLLALEIVEILKKEGEAVELCMVGPDKDGSMARCKKVAAELNLPITFAGMLSKEEWTALSKEYDIFINTTNFDNMPVSVMEAMALGLPVISTDVGGMPFLIDDGKDGVLVAPNNAQAFVKAIRDLIQNPSKVERLTENAREKMEAHDWEVVKGRWNDVIGSIGLSFVIMLGFL